jgi:hypothetical protein
MNIQAKRRGIMPQGDRQEENSKALTQAPAPTPFHSKDEVS